MSSIVVHVHACTCVRVCPTFFLPDAPPPALLAVIPERFRIIEHGLIVNTSILQQGMLGSACRCAPSLRFLGFVVQQLVSYSGLFSFTTRSSLCTQRMCVCLSLCMLFAALAHLCMCMHESLKNVHTYIEREKEDKHKQRQGE